MSLYVCANIKQYPENFTFLILGILELFAREVFKTVGVIVSECL